MNKNFSVKVITAIIILLSLLVISLGIYYIYVKYIQDDLSNKTTYKVLYNQDEEIEIGTRKKIDVNIGTKNVTLYLEPDAIFGGSVASIMYFGNKMVLSSYVIDEVFLFGDTIIAVSGGIDITDTTINGYNYKGEKVLSLSKFDADKTIHIGSDRLYSYSLYQNEYQNMERDFYVMDDKLYVYGNKLTHGISVIIPGDDLFIDDYPEVCNPEELVNNNITEDTEVEFKYVISNLGNNKFSKPKQIDSLTLKSFINDCKQYN